MSEWVGVVSVGAYLSLEGGWTVIVSQVVLMLCNVRLSLLMLHRQATSTYRGCSLRVLCNTGTSHTSEKHNYCFQMDDSKNKADVT